ncbi:MAG: AMP-binding protein [Planctomycetota bacterium]
MNAQPALVRDLLDRIADSETVFLTARGESLDGDRFVARTEELARRIVRAGVPEGARVCSWLEPSVDLAVFPFACALAGVVAVIVNPRLLDAQVRHVVDDCDAHAVLTSPTKLLATRDRSVAFGDRRLWMIDSDGKPGIEELPRDIEATPLRGRDDADAPAIFLYTSGSTGKPKAIVQTERSLCDGARIVAGYLGLTHRDKVAAVLPLSFDYGLNQLTAAMFARSQVGLLSYLTAADLLRHLVRGGFTGLAGVPEIWVDVAAHLATGRFDAGELRALRYVTNSGGRLPDATIAVLLDRLPWVSVFSMYGLTEAFRSSFVPPAELREGRRGGGRAMPGVELFVVDPQSRRVLAPGAVGELVHCGACVGLGYHQRPESTARHFGPHPLLGESGGRAVYSGDLASMDEGGNVTLHGRIDAQIKVGGYRVSPDEVIEVVRRVTGVHTAAAVGVPRSSDGLTELVVAIVPTDAKGDLAALRAQVLARVTGELPRWMVPARIEFYSALPQSPNQKIDLAALRELLTVRDG